MLRLDAIDEKPDTGAQTEQRKRKSSHVDESSGSSSDDDDDALDARLLRRDDETIEEEKELESMLFGSKTTMMADIEKKSRNRKVKQVSESLKAQPVEMAEAFETRKPVWEDPDDQEVVDLNKYGTLSSLAPDSQTSKLTSSQIEDTLKAKYNKYFGTPMWADLDFKKSLKKKKKRDDDSSDEDEDLKADDESEFFQQTGNFLENTDKKRSQPRTLLPKTNIEIKVCTDANKEEPHQARLRSVEFHPSARVLLAAGLGQKLTLFQIDGKKNPKIQTIFFDKFPILAAHFTKQSGDEIVLGSRHKNFYYYDMHAGKMVCVRPPCKALDEHQRPSMSACFDISPDNRFMAFVGSQGQVHLFSTKSKEWIQTVKINQECNAIAFSSDSRYLFAFGDGKDVYVFDMNDRGKRCLNRFADEGCLSGTSIAVSPNSQFLATGCKSGVVNIYNLSESLLGGEKGDRNPRPIKSFMNLTTPCTSLKFNSSSEILAACSSFGENSCKLIHTGSMTVFSNFPIQTDKSSVHTRMRIPECVDFSLNSGYFTIGNNKGNALLYRLKHYGSY